MCRICFTIRFRGRWRGSWRSGRGWTACFSRNSGTEAVEGALKLARAGSTRKHGAVGKTRILAMEDSFHGRTFGALVDHASAEISRAICAAGAGRGVCARQRCGGPGSEIRRLGLRRGHGGDSGRRRNFSDQRALSGSARANSPSQYGAALIADEIQCGLGRTGRLVCLPAAGRRCRTSWWSRSRWPAGCRWARFWRGKVLRRRLRPGLHGSTFGGGPLACAVGAGIFERHRRRRTCWRTFASGARNCARDSSSLAGDLISYAKCAAKV